MEAVIQKNKMATREERLKEVAKRREWNRRPERYQVEKVTYHRYLVDGVEFHEEWYAQSVVMYNRWMDDLEDREEAGVFEIKPYHVELIRRLRFSFDLHEDTKRFRAIEISEFAGLGSAEQIIGQAMGIAYDSTYETKYVTGEDVRVEVYPCYSQEIRNYIDQVYLEFKTCLDILTYNLTIQPGTYYRRPEPGRPQPARVFTSQKHLDLGETSP